MIQPGNYIAKAINGQLCEGKTALYVSVQLGTKNGQSVYWSGSLSDKPWDNAKDPSVSCPADTTIRDLIKMGWDGQDYVGFMGLGSTEVEIRVTHEPGNDGKTYPRVKYVNRPGERGNAKPVAPDRARALQASMRGRVIAAQREMGPARPAQQAPAESDDFPFGANSPDLF